MRTMLAALSLLVSTAWLAPDLARATPGDAYDEPVRIEILDASAVTCSPRGALCIKPGDSSTLVTSPPMASLGRASAQEVPRFVRASALQGASKGLRANDSSPWTLQVDARLRQPALAGNTLFLLYDAQDAKALSSREVTALWQAPLPAGDRMAARLSLSPDDGFHPAHNYRIRVVQLVGGKEVLLAEGTVGLD